MSIPKAKLKAILRYFCTNTNPIFLGKVKLMKLFYFIDFMFIKQYGISITKDTYIHLEHGPIPTKILNLVNSVVDDSENALLSDTIYIENPIGKMQQIKCHKSFTEKDERYFSQAELDIMKKVCLRFGNETTKSIEDASHNEASWKETKIGQEIPYVLAAKDNDCLVEEDDIKLLNAV